MGETIISLSEWLFLEGEIFGLGYYLPAKGILQEFFFNQKLNFRKSISLLFGYADKIHFMDISYQSGSAQVFTPKVMAATTCFLCMQPTSQRSPRRFLTAGAIRSTNWAAKPATLPGMVKTRGARKFRMARISTPLKPWVKMDRTTTPKAQWACTAKAGLLYRQHLIDKKSRTILVYAPGFLLVIATSNNWKGCKSKISRLQPRDFCYSGEI